jgi:lactoylglutathione lyase/methylmalonyl-CoA/ethylmalonyl-CoA epimerase
MIKKISHIGLAVDNLEEARNFFDDTFGLSVSAQEQFGELLFSFISLGETELELLQSTTAEGQIARFIQKRGQGIHHISLEVDDIQAELDRLKSKGLQLINETPYRNAHEDLVAFIHPKSTYGVLIELIQSNQK